jgi:hypothetical protein
MKSTKAAPHRKAIQEAAAIISNPATNNNSTMGSIKNSTINNSSTKKPKSGTNGGVSDSTDLSQISFTTGPVSDPMNDDYEGNKVGKSKKNQYDAEIKMVQDLDRWG